MAAQTGAQLAAGIRAAFAELKTLCAGVDEADAGRAPAGRWSPREILSHLIGPAQGAYVALLERFTPDGEARIDIVAEQTHYAGERPGMRFAQLVDMAEGQYEALAAYAQGLDAERLARRARIPLFRDTPLTDHPTLEAVAAGLGQFHVRQHTEHLRQVLAELAAEQPGA